MDVFAPFLAFWCFWLPPLTSLASLFQADWFLICQERGNQNYAELLCKNWIIITPSSSFLFYKRFPSIAYLLPQPFASFPPSPCLPNLVCGTDRLAGEKKNNPVLHCPFKLILCCLRMTEANTTYIKICSVVSSDDFRNLFNAQSWETIVSSSWASIFYRFVYCFS